MTHSVMEWAGLAADRIMVSQLGLHSTVLAMSNSLPLLRNSNPSHGLMARPRELLFADHC
jgi:hypothetical protein